MDAYWPMDGGGRLQSLYWTFDLCILTKDILSTSSMSEGSILSDVFIRGTIKDFRTERRFKISSMNSLLWAIFVHFQIFFPPEWRGGTPNFIFKNIDSNLKDMCSKNECKQ